MPRLTVTFDEEHWITLRRLARVQGRSASAIIRELVEAVEPGLRRAADLGEAAAEATEDELEALRRAVAQVDVAGGAGPAWPRSASMQQIG